MSDDHDHSGDDLGASEPVASVNVDEVTIQEFAQPSSYIVSTDGTAWYALRTATQDIEFQSTDGIEVINAALAQLGTESNGAASNGAVRVTPRAQSDGSEEVISSDTTLEHTTDGTALILERGTSFEYTGTDQAVIIAGDHMHFEFEVIRADEASHVVRDLGLSDSTVHGHVIAGGTESVWFCDAANQTHTPSNPARSDVLLTWMRPADGAAYGIEMTSAEGARSEGYRWVLPIMFGTNEAGVLLGDQSDADTVKNNVFYGDIDVSQGDGTALLIEINDSHNGVYLKDFIRTSGGSFENRGTDIRIAESATDSFVVPLTYARVRTERNALAATDMSRMDDFKSATTRRFDIYPDSLSGYDVDEEGSGRVALYAGHLEQTTGAELDSLASISRRHDVDYGRLTFDNRAMLQTNVQVSDNVGQEAWLVWGSPDGPAVGWHIEDDRLEGYVHDGDAAATVPLRTGFDSNASWNLTAFAHPPSDHVVYYVADTYTGSTEATSDDTLTELDPDTNQLGGVHLKPVKGIEAEASVETLDLGDFEAAFPSGVAGGRRIMTIALRNTVPGNKALSWTNWRHHQQFPLFHR